MKIRSLSGLSVALSLTVAAGTSYAESEPVLEEVLVTAQGRTESIQDTPLSINALQGDQLENSRLNRMEDLQDFVPNLSMTQSGISTQIYVRGIGSGNNQGFEQSVPQFVDGVFYGRQQLLRAPFYDLDRVEVLRGPQPILFGKNAVAGAINLATSKPTDETEVRVFAGYEFEQEGRELQVMANGAISDNVNGRIAIRSFDDDGYIDNSFSDSQEPVRDEFSARVTFDAAVSDNLIATWKSERDTFNVKGRQIEVIQDDAGMAAANFETTLGTIGFPGAIGDSDLDYTRRADADEYSDNVLTNHTLKLEYQAGEYLVTSTTAKVGYEFDELCDCDFIGAPVFDLLLDEDYDQVSQEIRIVSPLGERFDWLAGVYYQSSELNFSDFSRIENGTVFPTLGLPIGGTGVVREFTQETDVYSAFGQLSFSMAERVHATLGLRYTLEEKEATKSLDVVNLSDGSINTSPTVAFVYNDRFLIETNQAGGGGPHDLDDDLRAEEVSASVNVEFDINDDVLSYVSLTQGFKSGGFDARSNTAANFEFEKEKALALELGIKSTLADGRGELNATAYRTQYKNLQVSQFDGALGFNVGNAKKTVVQGLEVDGRWGISSDLTMTYSAAYLDHEFEDFKNGNCYQYQVPDGDFVDGTQLCDYSGKSGQYTPEYSASIGLEYLLPVGDGLDLRFTTNANWVDEQNVHVNLAPEGDIDAYTLLNVGVALEADDWNLALLVKNALDEEIVTYRGNAPLSGTTFNTNTQYGFIAQPMTIVLQGSKTFR